MRNQNIIRFLPPPEDGGSPAHNLIGFDFTNRCTWSGITSIDSNTKLR